MAQSDLPLPLQCPRIGVWPVPESNSADRAGFSAHGRMRVIIDASFEGAWKSESLLRYTFDADGFADCHDHGVWVSRSSVPVQACETLTDLPAEIAAQGIEVEIVPSLTAAAKEFFDFETSQFRTSLHVSMIRMTNLPDWPAPSGKLKIPRPMQAPESLRSS